MLRVDLLEKLGRVAPALSGNNLVPVLSHFWFTESGNLMAYNDQIAISTKLESDFVGAVPSMLTSLLTASRAKDVEINITDKGNLEVKAASSRFKLPFIEAKAFEIFTMPKPSKDALPVDAKEFLAAIESCMLSLKEDTSMPDSLGITVVYKNKGFDLYATNDATISYARVKASAELKNFRVVLPGSFCRQMLSLAKLEGNKHIEVHDDYALFESGDSLLFGRLVDVARPLDFAGVIQQSFPKEAAAGLVLVPSKLELILDRAVIITESKQERPKTEIKIKDGKAHFFSRSENGEVNDSTMLEANHPAVEVSIDPRLFKAGYGAYDKMLLTKQCLIMSKGQNLYLVSAAH